MLIKITYNNNIYQRISLCGNNICIIINNKYLDIISPVCSNSNINLPVISCNDSQKKKAYPIGY